MNFMNLQKKTSSRMAAVTVEKKRKVASTEFRSQSTGTVLAQSLKRPNPLRQAFTFNSTKTSTHECFTLLAS